MLEDELVVQHNKINNLIENVNVDRVEIVDTTLIGRKRTVFELLEYDEITEEEVVVMDGKEFAKAEIMNYKKMTVLDHKSDPLEWYKLFKGSFPLISSLARK